MCSMVVLVNKSNEQLMQLVVQGNKNAFEILYQRFFRKLVWYACTFINDQQKAEDTVQGVFVKLIENPSLFDTQRNFNTWIYAVTGNACKNVLRDEFNRSTLLKAKNANKNEIEIQKHHMDHSLLKRKIALVLEEMTEKEKHIYSLRFEQELSIKEIAEILKLPEGSIKSGLFYLIKKFTPHLKEFNA